MQKAGLCEISLEKMGEPRSFWREADVNNHYATEPNVGNQINLAIQVT